MNAWHGGFNGDLAEGDRFGFSSAGIGGDLNGDGVLDIVVGAYYDDDGGTNAGAVYILFMQTDGKVLSHQKVSALHGGFTGDLASDDLFGVSSAGVGGDLNGDAYTEVPLVVNGTSGPSSSNSGDDVLDLVVGACYDDDGGYDVGAVYILFMQTNGKVLSHQKVSALHGGFTGDLASDDYFGGSCAGVGGDLNGDDVLDLVVGAYFDDDGGSYTGAVYIILGI